MKASDREEHFCLVFCDIYTARQLQGLRTGTLEGLQDPWVESKGPTSGKISSENSSLQA